MLACPVGGVFLDCCLVRAAARPVPLATMAWNRPLATVTSTGSPWLTCDGSVTIRLPRWTMAYPRMRVCLGFMDARRALIPFRRSPATCIAPRACADVVRIRSSIRSLIVSKSGKPRCRRDRRVSISRADAAIRPPILAFRYRRCDPIVALRSA